MRDPERRQDPEQPIAVVAIERPRHAVGVEARRGCRREADAARDARGPEGESRADRLLRRDRDREALRAEPPRETRQAAEAAILAPLVVDEHPIERGVVGNQGTRGGRDEHRDRRVRKPPAERRRERRRQDDVAEESGLHEQDAFAGHALVAALRAVRLAGPRAGVPERRFQPRASGFASSISITGMSSMMGYST